MKKDFDGNVIWVNRNGDGFIDRYVGAEAEAAGVMWEDNVWGIDVAVTSWGITVWGQFNTPIDGIVFGPDGNGLFHMDFRGAGVPGGIPGVHPPGERGHRLRPASTSGSAVSWG